MDAAPQQPGMAPHRRRASLPPHSLFTKRCPGASRRYSERSSPEPLLRQGKEAEETENV